MEFVEGATLREKIHGDKSDLRTLLKYRRRSQTVSPKRTPPESPIGI
jgi:hypothetical protein